MSVVSPLRIVACRIQVPPMFQDQFTRPLTLDISSPENISTLEHDTYGFKNLSASALASVAPSIVKPSAQIGTTAYIDNGWRQPRFRFYMEGIFNETAYGESHAIILGYTDYNGASTSGAIDPQMRFYISNAMQYTLVRNINPQTGMIDPKPQWQSNSQIIGAANAPELNGHTNRLRAQDVVLNMRVKESMLDSPMSYINLSNDQYSPVAADRNRLMPAMYLKDILNAGRYASSQINDSLSSQFVDGTTAFYDEVLGKVSDKSATQNEIMSQLYAYCGYGSIGYVTWQQLCQHFNAPPLDSVTQLVMSQNTMDFGVNTDPNRGFGIDNQIMAILQNIVPSIMSNLMIDFAQFTITNQTLNGDGQAIIDSLTPVGSGQEVRGLGATFKNYLEMMLHPALSNMNRVSYVARVSCSLLSYISAEISTFNGSPSSFAAPTYADSMMTPFGFATQEDVDAAALGAGMILENLSDVMSNSESTMVSGAAPITRMPAPSAPEIATPYYSSYPSPSPVSDPTDRVY